MTWRLAKGLEKLRAQVNAKWPNRSKDSDGSIGDANHSARLSDHNPDDDGVVKAIDITHDPKGGFDSYAFADMLLKNRDLRIKYVISNRRIASGSDGPSPWTWRKYSGANPHDHHVHISIKADKGHYDNTSEWDINGNLVTSPQTVKDYVRPNPTLKRGMSGDDVKLLQTKLGITADGIFGANTETYLKAFQLGKGLVGDGIAGPQTWKALGA